MSNTEEPDEAPKSEIGEAVKTKTRKPRASWKDEIFLRKMANIHQMRALILQVHEAVEFLGDDYSYPAENRTSLREDGWRITSRLYAKIEREQADLLALGILSKSEDIKIKARDLAWERLRKDKKSLEWVMPRTAAPSMSKLDPEKRQEVLDAWHSEILQDWIQNEEDRLKRATLDLEEIKQSIMKSLTTENG